ncbi:MAG TPA: helix-turn-helix transcriptional regulator [Casimicrobiaceae bacterium]|nr:helix-turn-helix transcriptional regulator [Casimicrobiaceae bacterium]
MERSGTREIAIAVNIGDPELADRVVGILADVTGVRLVTSGEPADLMVIAPGAARGADGEWGGNAGDVGQARAGDSMSTLTPREREVLALLAEGATNKVVARRLGISVHTVKFHVGSLIGKLDATGRTDAVAHAARLGIIVL